MHKCKISEGQSECSAPFKKRMACVITILMLTLFLVCLFIPEHLIIPVMGGKKADWHEKSFWYYPWGISGVHKGIDIFASEGTSVISATSGLVIFEGNLQLGGNVVAVMGPKWHINYYAHLNSIDVRQWSFVLQGQKIGTVGTTGNAAGKPPHLHYAVVTPIPYMWRMGTGKQGWKKMFYLNPDELLRN